MEWLIIFFVLLACMQVYFYIAARSGIIDRPNDRSSHSVPTVRGGGVIFIAALLCWFVASGFTFPFFLAGAVLIAIISFTDDIKTQSPLLRMVFHVGAFVLIGLELSLFGNIEWWFCLIVFIIGIGALNAFNFMDGINGMSGVYALVALVTFLVIDATIVDFTDANLLITLAVGIGIFLWYNFRKKAHCFAGDVGSITLAFVMVFLVLQLIVATGDYGWFVVFGVYAVDSVGTIVYRLLNRENIFKAHRSHVYQYLANEKGYPHLWISASYGFLQAAINLVVCFYLPRPTFLQGITIVLTMAVIYFFVREQILVSIKRPGVLTGLLKSNRA